jgi:hypothetical protein
VELTINECDKLGGIVVAIANNLCRNGRTDPTESHSAERVTDYRVLLKVDVRPYQLKCTITPYDVNAPNTVALRGEGRGDLLVQTVDFTKTSEVQLKKVCIFYLKM